MQLEDVFPNNDHRNRSVWRKYLAHARYALDSDSIDKCEEHEFSLAEKVSHCFYEDGRWKEAENLEKHVTETRKRVLGEEHPDTLTSMATLLSYGKSLANICGSLR